MVNVCSTNLFSCLGLRAGGGDIGESAVALITLGRLGGLVAISSNSRKALSSSTFKI